MKKIFLYGDREKRANYIAALEACGVQAVVSLSPQDSAGCGGLLLPGGADMEPAFYGAENTASRGIDRALDHTELALAHGFAASGKPILGICRGLQVLNVAFGGDLLQHLPAAGAHCWEESTGDKQHPITAPPESFLYRLYGARFPVNSAHHQGVGCVAPGFQIAARAEDGTIEALCCPERHIYAVQFHPERMALRLSRNDTVDGLPIFQFFMGLIS